MLRKFVILELIMKRNKRSPSELKTKFYQN